MRIGFGCILYQENRNGIAKYSMLLRLVRRLPSTGTPAPNTTRPSTESSCEGPPEPYLKGQGT